MRQQYVLAEILDKGNAFVSKVLPVRSTTVLRWNATSTTTFTLRDGHPLVSTLTTQQGLRCAIWLVTVTDGIHLTKRRLLEGTIGNITGTDAPFGTVQVPVSADFADLTTILGWQVPTAGISGQGAAEYARYSGPCETRVKDAIRDNVTRLGLPWDITASLGRGTDNPLPLEVRMDPLAEQVLPPLIQEKLQLTVERDRATGRTVVDVRAGTEFPRPITPQSGVLAHWEWVDQPATATRAVVGGRTVNEVRQYALVVDTALEAQIGTVREIWVNASSAEEGAPLEPYGWAELAKRAAKSGLKTVLREASWFRFPESYDLGDKLTVHIGALHLQDAITQIEITSDAVKGVTVVPTLGTAAEDPQTRLVGFIKNVASAVGGLQRR